MVADKLGMSMPNVVAPARELTHLVTERFVPDAVVTGFENLGMTVIRA